MSTSCRPRTKSNRQKQLDRLQRRLNSPRPDLPILRTAERSITPASQTAGLAPRSSEVPVTIAVNATANQHEDPLAVATPNVTRLCPPCPPTPDDPDASPAPATTPHSALDTQHSALPEWTRLLPLPNNLPRTFRSFLYRYIEENHKPTDTHESYLAARIAQAMARKHLSAAREPEDQPNSLWLRYESLADRELKAAQRDWYTHKKSSKPAPPKPAPTPPHSSSMEAPSPSAGFSTLSSPTPAKPSTTSTGSSTPQHSRPSTHISLQTPPISPDRSFVNTHEPARPSDPAAPRPLTPQPHPHRSSTQRLA